jgi:hypothetical protein
MPEDQVGRALEGIDRSLKSIDATNERIEAGIQAIHATNERIEVTNKRLELTTERVRLEFERNRAFNREMLSRWEASDERWSAESEAGRKFHAALVAQINDMRREIRAQTEAIFRVIDRLDGSGGTRPATS